MTSHNPLKHLENKKDLNYRSPFFVSLMVGFSGWVTSFDTVAFSTNVLTVSKNINFTPTQILLSLSFFILVNSMCLPLWGRLSDKLTSPTVFKMSSLLYALISFLLIFSLSSYPLFFILRIIQGVFAAGMMASSVIVPKIFVHPERHKIATSYIFSLFALGSILALLFGPALLSNVRIFFALEVVLGIFCFVSIRFLGKYTVKPLHIPLKLHTLVLIGVLFLWLNLLLINIKIPLLALLYAVLLAITILAIYVLERKSDRRLIEFHLFKKLKFYLLIYGLIMVGVSYMSILIVTPYFTTHLHLTEYAYSSILIMLPLAFVISGLFFTPLMIKQFSAFKLIFTTLIILLLVYLGYLSTMNFIYNTTLIITLLVIFSALTGLVLNLLFIIFFNDMMMIAGKESAGFMGGIGRSLQNFGFGIPATFFTVIVGNKIPSQSNIMPSLTEFIFVIVTLIAILFILFLLGLKHKK